MRKEVAAASHARDLRVERAYRLARQDGFILAAEEVIDARFVVSRARKAGLVLESDLEEGCRLWWEADRFASAAGDLPLAERQGKMFADFRAALVGRLSGRFAAMRPPPAPPDLSKFKAVVGDLAAVVLEVCVVIAAERAVARLSSEVAAPTEARMMAWRRDKKGSSGNTKSPDSRPSTVSGLRT